MQKRRRSLSKSFEFLKLSSFKIIYREILSNAQVHKKLNVKKIGELWRGFNADRYKPFGK